MKQTFSHYAVIFLLLGCGSQAGAQQEENSGITPKRLLLI